MTNYYRLLVLIVGYLEEVLMRKVYINLLVLFITAAAFAQQAVEVLPINRRQSTEIYVKAGEVLNFKVEGQWSLWDRYGGVGGEGHPFKANSEYGNWGALLGVVGNGTPFLIGSGGDVTSDAEGVLYLFPNKGRYLIENETGKLNVTITGGTKLEDYIKAELEGKASHYRFDPLDGVLITDLVFEEGENAEIYAFGSWTMWEGVYPEVNADGHEFVADGIPWGKLYLGVGSSSGQYISSYSTGQKATIQINEKGILSFYPHVSNYIAVKNGMMDIYVVGGKKASEEDKVSVDELSNQYFSQVALDLLNRYREECKLPLLELNEGLNQAAIDHAEYMVENSSFSRNQSEEGLGFTGVSPEDRAEAAGYDLSRIREMFCQTETAEYAVDVLFNTVYHRIRLMNPDLKYLGYGSYKKADKTVHVFDFGYTTDATTDSDQFIYPADGAENVTIQWSGYEKPEPLPAGTVTPVGLPITALFKEKVSAVLTSELSKTESGETVECFVISSETDLNSRKIDGVVLVPKYILSPGTSYTVKVKVQLASGEEKEVSWAFTTTELTE